MDARSSRFASQITRLLPVAVAALLLVGCDLKVTDRTPSTFSANPSGVYTITAEIKARSVVVEDAIKPSVVINAQVHPMQRSELGKNMWEFDYKLPGGHTGAKYYIIVSYDTSAAGRVQKHEVFTQLSEFSVVNRYSLSLDASRAPVGARVSVLGRGFTESDVVYVGDTPAETTFQSPNALSFSVPPLPAARNYTVSVGSPGSGITVGTLRVDQGSLTVAPQSLSLTAGQRRPLVFSIPSAAPSGGVILDITTDVPASVIMPVVVIEAGQQSASVYVEGGEPGTGTIYVSAPGFGETTVSISVR